MPSSGRDDMNLVDEAGDESFPASDPPAWTAGHPEDDPETEDTRQPLTVGAICHRTVLLARRDTTVTEAARLMAESRVGTLVLIDDDEEPEAIVTDRDLVVRALAKGRNPDKTPLIEVSTPLPSIVEDGDSPLAALQVMRAAGARRLPVVDADGELCGILSLDDVLGHVLRGLGPVAELLARQAPKE